MTPTITPEAARLAEELRDACMKIRVKASIPLSALIPIMQRAADEIERLAAKQDAAPTSAGTVPEWISVEDQLPKEFCHVWIANFDDVERAIWSDTDREFLVEDVYGAYEKAYGVTHWMLSVIPAHPGACSVTNGEAKK